MPKKKVPFESLTRRGKLSRLRRLAWQALGEYDLQIASLSLLGWFTNLMFRVDTRYGQRFVLRLSAPGWRTDEDCRAETAWLLALARDTDLGTPVPQATRLGEYILFASLDGAPTTRCVLQSWVPGVNLGKHLSEPNLEKMGVLFAHLHAHGADWQPPADFTRRRMDQVLARDEPQALFTDDSRGMVPQQTWDIWERTRAAVEAAYARRYAMPGLQVIHHDLWHDNIKLHHGRLYPLDFEDTVWGYPVQDIGMAMQDLMEAVPPERYEPLLEAFRRGYESLRLWPEAYEGEMDMFRAGRMLWVGNYVARFQGQYLKEHLEHLAPVLERFLETGKLRKLAQ